MSGVKNKIIKSLMWMGGASLFSQLITWIFTFMIARLLSPEDYGLIGMAGIYIGITEYINELGVGPAIVQRQDLNDDDVRGIYTISIAFGFILMLITYNIAPFIAEFFKEARLTSLLHFLSLTYVISAAKSVQRNLLIRDMKFSLIAQVDVIAGISTGIGGLICALAGVGVWTLVFQFLFLNLFVFIGSFWFERRLPGRITNFKRLKEMLLFGIGITTSKFFSYIKGNIDSLIIGKLLGKTPLGNYTLAQTLANKPFEKILPIFNQVFFPVFSKIQQDKIKVREFLVRIIEIELLIFSPIFIFLSIIAHDTIIIVLGAKWSGAILPMQVFSMLGFCKYFESRISIVLTSLGYAKQQVYYTVALAFVLTISITVSAWFCGIAGALVSWSICYPLVLLTYLKYFLNFIDIPVMKIISAVKMPIATSMIMAASIFSVDFILYEPSLLRLSGKCLVAFIAYTGSNFLFNRKAFDELQDLVTSRNKGVATPNLS
jgi:teichuronic acid exporter